MVRYHIGSGMGEAKRHFSIEQHITYTRKSNQEHLDPGLLGTQSKNGRMEKLLAVALCLVTA